MLAVVSSVLVLILVLVLVLVLVVVLILILILILVLIVHNETSCVLYGIDANVRLPEILRLILCFEEKTCNQSCNDRCSNAACGCFQATAENAEKA